MRIKGRYKIRKIAGEKVVIMQGTQGADMTRIISLNDSAEWLVDSLADKDFTVEDAADLLLERYDVDRGRALEDARRWADTLLGCGFIIP